VVFLRDGRIVDEAHPAPGPDFGTRGIPGPPPMPGSAAVPPPANTDRDAT
jgi:hypothetical protein